MTASNPIDFSNALVLVDGSALAYRAHHAMARSSLSSPEGLPTGAIFGVATELRRLAALSAPRFCAAVFDTPEPTFRHELYEAYKATRKEMPDELVAQMPWILEACNVLGWKALALAGFEADDVIGTLTKAAEAAGYDVFIVTSDKDMMQLVGPRVSIYRLPRSGGDPKVIGTDEVREEWSVGPERIIDLLAIMGDTSDNIPGIPGIGEKGAKKLLEGGRSLEEILEDPGPDASARVKKAIAEHAEKGRLSKRLATIDCKVPLAVGLDDLAYGGPLSAPAAELFQKLGFRRLTQEMAGLAGQSQATEERARHACITTRDELHSLIGRLEKAEVFSVDTETTGLDPLHAELVGISFSWAEGEAAYIPLRGLDAPDWKEVGGRDGVLSLLAPLLADPRRRKCGQNVKFDQRILAHAGVRLSGILTDSMVASYLVEAHERDRNLDALALRHFGYLKIKTEALIGSGKNQITMDQVPRETITQYAGEDADYARRLSLLFLPMLEEAGAKALHDDVEIPLIDVLAAMEDEGVRVDKEALRAMAASLEKDLESLGARIHEAAGTEFNINSPRQLGDILFEKLKIHEATGRKPRRTTTGYATGQEVLEEYGDHELVGLVLEYRSLSKLVGTYLSPLPELVDPDTGRLHTSYHQTVAQTGRISSSDPNLQNIPIRTEVGRRVRGAFLPRDGHHKILSADYSQVELRIFAHLSEDPALVDAFRKGMDIHRNTAARVFGLDPLAVDATQRSRAKAINFGILYGMGPQRLARETSMSLEEAKAFIDRYFGAFPRVREFIETLKERARKTGYAETLLGRRRRIPEMGSKNRAVFVAAENMAVNTPIQGSAADILKVAMVRIHRRIAEEGLGTRMIMTVHDELVFDVPDDEIESASRLVREEMEGAFPLRVPLKVDLGVGDSWLQAH